ncbi:hypothetical protein BH23CHL6_BH23CHL6_08680 [soil metagenome]
MVLAGAGTGKTTVVVERVCHLLASQPDLQPESVLVLTYNVKAAAELVERLEKRLGLQAAGRLWVHNFHSFGHRILSDHRGDLGLQRNADVLDQVGQRLLLRQLRSRFRHFLYHPMARDPGAANRFAEMIGRAKDELVTPEEYMAFAHARREAFEIKHGAGTFDEVVATLRRRDAEGSLWQVRAVRRELAANGHAAADRIASREARREVVGTGEALWWTQLSREQEQLAKGLQPTYLRDAEAFETLRLIEEAEVYAVYQQALREGGLLDFGEQQLRTIQLLIDRPNILYRYQAQFRHVLVDEFQDVNMAQILLLELVGRGPDKPDNVVVVGDDDQSIYRFRGASYAAFERFRQRFEQSPAWEPERPAVRVGQQPLLENRRSTGHILSAADRLIGHNQRRLKRDSLRPIKSAGRPVDLLYATDETDEADFAVAWMKRVVDELPEPRRWSDIAVLYRRHRHRDLIVERLRKQGIPYVVVGGTGLFSVPEVRDVEAALRVAANPDNSVAFMRLLSAGPWRLDAAETMRLSRAADWDGRPIFQAAADILREREVLVPVVDATDEPLPTNGSQDPPTLWAVAALPDAAEQPETVRDRRNREQRTRWRREELDVRLRVKLERLFAVLDALAPRGRREGPFAILEDYLVRTNLLHDLIATETPDAQRSLLAIARFMRFVADWQAAHPTENLADFIAYLDVYQEVGGDLDTDLPGRVAVEGVQLMTVYQAKGLEYEAVVVPRLVEGQFPDTREEARLIPLELLKQEPPSDFAIDEERRLLFVAMTRARSRLLLSAVHAVGSRDVPSRFASEVAGLDVEEGPVLSDVVVERRQSGPQAEVEPGDVITQPIADTTAQLLKMMPVPQAHERRFALRRRAVELIGMLETLTPEDHEARLALTADLVAVAEQAAGMSDEAQFNGLDPLTLTVLSRHAPAGQTLLELAPLPNTFSHSQLSTYLECPLRYAFQKVYRIPVADTPGYFEFGNSIHQAFEGYARARREARAAGLPPPGYEALRQHFDAAWKPRNYPDAQAAEEYSKRVEPALRRFYDREIASLAEAVAFEIGFTLELEDPDGGSPVRFYGVIDRIDRHPDGSIEITDYKTGRPKTQADVDADQQLSAYALALAMGAVRHPETGEPLSAASRLTLYFTENDRAVTTTRTPEQLDEFRRRAVETAKRMRNGDFTATPDQWRCDRCDYRLICPSRWGSERVV